MLSFARYPLLMVALAGLSLLTAFSAAPFAANAESQRPMGITTGFKTGTYYEVGKDIADLAKKQDINILVRESNGSIDNLQKMVTSGENAALGIVQADVLSFLLKSDKPQSKEISHKLRAIAPLFKEEIHILANKSIRSVEDLAGKRVVVGSAGSGSMMTSINLFSLLNIKPQKMYQIEAPEAVVAVLADRADAMVFVGGKPVPMFKNLEQLRNTSERDMNTLLEKVHFLPIPADKVEGYYEAATITPQDYGFVGNPVPTLAVRGVLVTYDFTIKDTDYYHMRCAQLSRLGDALRDNLGSLKASGHGKWKEVDFSVPLPLWQRDKCAWPHVSAVAAKPVMGTPIAEKKPATPAAKPVELAKRTKLEKELLEILSH